MGMGAAWPQAALPARWVSKHWCLCHDVAVSWPAATAALLVYALPILSHRPYFEQQVIFWRRPARFCQVLRCSGHDLLVCLSLTRRSLLCSHFTSSKRFCCSNILFSSLDVSCKATSMLGSQPWWLLGMTERSTHSCVTLRRPSMEYCSR